MTSTNCHTHMNSLQPQKCQYEEDNVCATLPLLRLNLIDNLCRKAWPQPHFIDSFVMWMWYLAEERCLLLAPHAAIFSSHIFEICPSPFVCLQTHWSLGGGTSEFIRVITVNTAMCMCVFERLLFFARWGAEWSVWLECQPVQCAPLTDGECSHAHTHTVAIRHAQSVSKGPNQTYGKESVDTARHLQTTRDDTEQRNIIEWHRGERWMVNSGTQQRSLRLNANVVERLC